MSEATPYRYHTFHGHNLHVQNSDTRYTITSEGYTVAVPVALPNALQARPIVAWPLFHPRPISTIGKAAGTDFRLEAQPIYDFPASDPNIILAQAASVVAQGGRRAKVVGLVSAYQVAAPAKPDTILGNRWSYVP